MLSMLPYSIWLCFLYYQAHLNSKVHAALEKNHSACMALKYVFSVLTC